MGNSAPRESALRAYKVQAILAENPARTGLIRIEAITPEQAGAKALERWLSTQSLPSEKTYLRAEVYEEGHETRRCGVHTYVGRFDLSPMPNEQCELADWRAWIAAHHEIISEQEGEPGALKRAEENTESTEFLYELPWHACQLDDGRVLIGLFAEGRLVNLLSFHS